MSIEVSRILVLATLIAAIASAQPQAGRAAGTEGARPKPQDTEVWQPEPKVVTPGATNTEPPSDAIVLFDGKNLDEWVSAQDHTPAKWTVANGILTVNKTKGVGN